MKHFVIEHSGGAEAGHLQGRINPKATLKSTEIDAIYLYEFSVLYKHCNIFHAYCGFAFFAPCVLAFWRFCVFAFCVLNLCVLHSLSGRFTPLL